MKRRSRKSEAENTLLVITSPGAEPKQVEVNLRTPRPIKKTAKMEFSQPEEPENLAPEALLQRIKRLEQRVAELEMRGMPIGGRF